MVELSDPADAGSIEHGVDRFRTFFDHSSDAILVCRLQPDGRFVYEMINKAAERLFGLAPDQVIGRMPEEVFLPETAYAHENGYRLSIARAGEPVLLHRTLTFPAGTVRLETIVTALTDPRDPAAIRVISGSRDLSAREQVEQRMQHSQCLDVIAQLTGGVAHDVNNLLTVVIGNLALLRRRLGDADDKVARYLSSIETAALRGAKLTASLLAFSRRQTLNLERLDLDKHIRLSELFLRQVVGRDVALAIDAEPGLPPAHADAAQFEAALLNLVVNARDAVAEPGAAQPPTIAITLRRVTLGQDALGGNADARPGEFIAVAVQDNGAGMTASVRARAFEPFFTTKDVGRGAGLGLSQVFGFVRQLGGHVRLDAAPGQGTVVTLFLPPAEPAQVESVTITKRAPPPRNACVLVVEDDPSIVEVTAEVLRDGGFEVITAGGARNALEILRGSHRVDLLFTDVVMPGGATGHDLALAALELRPSLPVLLTSGYPEPGTVRFELIDRFPILRKPFTREGLLAQIDALLSRRSTAG